MIVGIAVLAILATGFLSAFYSVLSTSSSPLQTVVMENVAASQMDKLLSGTFQSAVAASSVTPASSIVDGTVYWAYTTGQSSVVSALAVVTTVPSGVHLTVTVSNVSLSGDSFDVH